ncbi:MAG: TPM domain-containing protein [Betaproteobacteria bacterium]|nr:TPM domain-containing protein [Betaproteobacteria bacterium]
MNLARILRHLMAPRWLAGRMLPATALARIEAAIDASEARHRGEIRYVVEAGLDFAPLLGGITPRERAIEIFSQLRLWDTEENTGVLIYVQLIDHDIEIVADRGINAEVPQAQWDAICHRMEEAFRAGRHAEGVLEGIKEITALLARHFPPRGANPDELPDKPVVL